MGVLGDTVNEFKKASKTEKVFIVGGALAVLAIALYIRQQSQAGKSATGPTGATLTGGVGGGGIQTVPGPNQSTVPILPAGLTPLFDAMGNLIGYQPLPTQTTPSLPIQQGILGTSPGVSSWTIGGIPATVGGLGRPLLPQGTKIPQSGQYNYQGQTYTVVPGAGGRTWGVPGTMPAAAAAASPTKVLLIAPSSYYSNVPQGGGPYGTRVLSVHGARIAPTLEMKPQFTQATRIYAIRNRFK